MRIVVDMQGAQSTGSRNRGIGRYTNAIAKGLVRNRGEHEIVLAISGQFPDTIEPIFQAFAGLLPSENIRVWHAATPASHIDKASNWRRCAAELGYEAFLSDLSPDFIYVTSLFEGLGDDSVTSIHALQQDIPVAVTLYDLIPYINPKPYLENPDVKSWYMEKIEHLRRADLWLSISESSRQEGIVHLGLSPEQSVNIATDADDWFQPIEVANERAAALRDQYGLTRPFVLYTGGIDHRKNVEGLIRAYACLPEPLRRDHQLAIVCSVQPASRDSLERLASQQGLAQDEVVLTGFVSDEDLLVFYNLCKLFVFPSWHEGFGLPALEAMRCGAPVIGANTSSLPEVIGWDEALFDPYSDQAIAAAIQRGLSDEHYRQELLKHGLTQAGRFSWDESARRAIAAMERQHEARLARPVSPNTASRLKLAYVSPLPPVRSGIADYSTELLPELAKFYDIEVVVAQDEVSDPWVLANCPVRTPEWFLAHAQDFDRVLYHFGNSEFHQHMFGMLKAVPGVLVLHDFYLSGLVAYMESTGRVPGFWSRQLYGSHGHDALREQQLTRDKDEVIWKYPCSLGAIKDGLGTIVHSRHSLRLASQWFGLDESGWAVVPHMRDAHLGEDAALARKALGFKEGDFLVCSFGLMGPTKMNHRLVQAWLQSSLAQDPCCHLVFVGEAHVGDYGSALLKMIQSHPWGDRVRITGWTDTAEFRRYLAAADVGVQLRTLSRGETSGTVLDSMNYAKPTIVNANGSMADLDPEGVWMLPDEFTDEALVEALETLRSDPARSQQIGGAARNIILTLHDPATCAAQYRDAIEDFYRHGRADGLQSLVRAIVDQAGLADDGTLMQVSAALARNAPPRKRQPQVLVDVSDLSRPGADARARHDHGLSGALKEWLARPPKGVRVEPVQVDKDGRYRYARRYVAELQGYVPVLPDEPIDYWRGDVWIGWVGTSPVQPDLYQDLRQHGVTVRLCAMSEAGLLDLAGLFNHNEKA